MNVRSPPTGVRVKAAKVLYCVVQRIRYVVRIDVIPVAVEDIFIDQLRDYGSIYILHGPEKRLK
jgi:hypothetical protein